MKTDAKVRFFIYIATANGKFFDVVTKKRSATTQSVLTQNNFFYPTKKYFGTV